MKYRRRTNWLIPSVSKTHSNLAEPLETKKRRKNENMRKSEHQFTSLSVQLHKLSHSLDRILNEKYFGKSVQQNVLEKIALNMGINYFEEET